MNPREHQEQIGLFPAAPASATSVEVDVLRAQAARARDAAITATVRRAAGAVWQVLSALGDALLTFPARRGVYDELRQLSDRELADIGLTRGDIVRVFEPGFQVPARAANANQPVVAKAKAA